MTDILTRLRDVGADVGRSEVANEIERLREALTVIADWDKVNSSNEYEHGLRDIIRSITDHARNALNR